MVPVGYAYNIPQNCEHYFANRLLTFFIAGYLLQHNSTLVLRFDVMHHTFIYGDNSVYKFITSTFMMRHELLANIQCAHTHLPAAHIYNYSLQLPTQNGCFVHYFLLRNRKILFNESFNKTLVCLISCSS